MWWDVGEDAFIFDELKAKCPNTVLYNIAINGRTLNAATKNYDLNQILSDEDTMKSYIDMLNEELKDHLCIERE